jgi:hypothetical protein
LVRHDAVQPPLSPLYDGPFLVLERSLHFFKLQVGSRIDTVSTHRLKPCHTPEETQATEPPRRGQPPIATKSVGRQPLSGSRQQSCLSPESPGPKRLRRVSLADPVVISVPPPPRPPPAPPVSAAQQPDRRATPPKNQHTEL